MFKNWLTGSASNEDICEANATATPPDLILEVGPPPFTRFAAHRALLSAHSGYLCSAIRPSTSVDTPIYIPSVTSEQFAPLLTYMYTGILDLSIDNIFSVLLATHVLHMPRALEICRAFLARTQTETYQPHYQPLKPAETTVIRPIASKASGPSLGFISAPAPNVILPSNRTQFKSLTLSERTAFNQSPIASTSSTQIPGTNQPVNGQRSGPPKTGKAQSDRYVEIVERSSKSTAEGKAQSAVSAPSDKDNRIIVDIASCDGPVRFHRVLNDAYGAATNSENQLSAQLERNVTNSFHQQMAININNQQQQQQQQQRTKTAAAVDEVENCSRKVGGGVAKGTSTDEQLFVCNYCKHTFKSQYCYQKHAKRHLNPLPVGGKIDRNAVSGLCGNSDSEGIQSSGGGELNESNGEDNRATSVKREVRLLDMNVQYYPCKTCGSKFPSYYFVHKHRKLCHNSGNEEECAA